VLTEHLQDFLTRLEADLSLLETKQLRERLNILDDLDTAFGNFDSEAFKKDTNGGIHHRAEAIRTQLEAVNADLYQSNRSEMKHGAPPHALLQWIQTSASRGEKEIPAPGLRRWAILGWRERPRAGKIRDRLM
jgi:hypothetical protein